jgi:hypothetical protein
MGLICWKLIAVHPANLLENLRYHIPKQVPADSFFIRLKLIVGHVANLVANLGYNIPKYVRVEFCVTHSYLMANLRYLIPK